MEVTVKWSPQGGRWFVARSFDFGWSDPPTVFKANVAKTTYFDTLVSNDITKEGCSDRPSETVLYDGYSYFIKHGCMRPLEDTRAVKRGG